MTVFEGFKGLKGCLGDDRGFLQVKSATARLRTGDLSYKKLGLSSSTPAQVINTHPLHNFFRLFIAQNFSCTSANKIKLNMIRRARVGALHGVDEGRRASGSASNFPELYANWADRASKDAVE